MEALFHFPIVTQVFLVKELPTKSGKLPMIENIFIELFAECFIICWSTLFAARYRWCKNNQSNEDSEYSEVVKLQFLQDFTWKIFTILIFCLLRWSA